MRETPQGTLVTGQSSLRFEGTGLVMQRPVENLTFRLTPVRRV
ncbi:MAG: hypothetical protein Q7J57_07175 [Gemmobacter sp.]|nr:hypothetical protein [Gemmobacter sp.]